MDSILNFITANWEALLAIIAIDIILSGDNAVVIAMAARLLPKEQQKKAVFIGTFGAIALRILFAAIVVWLIKIPFLQAVGGILLVIVAYKLIAEEEGDANIKAGTTLAGAVGTIIYSDALMSLDNVIAVAGVGHGDIILIAIGVLVSIPIILLGSTIILKAIEKFPIITYIGSGVLAWTAAGMMVHDRILSNYIPTTVGTIVCIVVTIGVVLAGWLRNRKAANEQERAAA
ncbi:TerC family protein [uncultured Brevibacillus sp.]|uniref:TerC family protein n=1 Tax=uncultured Brevibacillus sp. TaxID=169970 RepID=UPI002591B919|nr:TerC family protein [uncultured Brevibacillus sp.]